MQIRLWQLRLGCSFLACAPALVAWWPGWANQLWPLRLAAVAAGLMLPGLPVALTLPAGRRPSSLGLTLFLGCGLTALFQPLCYWAFQWTGQAVTQKQYALLLLAFTALAGLFPLVARARGGPREETAQGLAVERGSLACAGIAMGLVMFFFGRIVLADLDAGPTIPIWPRFSDERNFVHRDKIRSQLEPIPLPSPSAGGGEPDSFARFCRLSVVNSAGASLPYLLFLDVRAPRGVVLELRSSGKRLARVDLAPGHVGGEQTWFQREPTSFGRGVLEAELTLPPGESVFLFELTAPEGRGLGRASQLVPKVHLTNMSDVPGSWMRHALCRDYVTVLSRGKLLDAHEAFSLAAGSIDQFPFVEVQPPRGYYALAAAILTGGWRLSSLSLLTLAQLGLLYLALWELFACTAEPLDRRRAWIARAVLLVATMAYGTVAYCGSVAFLVDTTYTLDLVLAGAFLGRGCPRSFLLFGMLASLGRQPGPVPVTLLLLGGLLTSKLTERQVVKLFAALVGLVGGAYLAMGLFEFLHGGLGDWFRTLYFELVEEHTTEAGHRPSLPGAITWLATLCGWSAGLALAAPFAERRCLLFVGPSFFGYLLPLCLLPRQPHYFLPLIALAGVLAAAAMTHPGERDRPAVLFLLSVASLGLLLHAFHMLSGWYLLPEVTLSTWWLWRPDGW